MTFFEPPSGSGANLADSLYITSLPAAACAACNRSVGRRKHRIVVRASWRSSPETLCLRCWVAVCQRAVRFALEQGELGL